VVKIRCGCLIRDLVITVVLVVRHLEAGVLLVEAVLLGHFSERFRHLTLL